MIDADAHEAVVRSEVVDAVRDRFSKRFRQTPYSLFWKSLKQGTPTTKALDDLLGDHDLAQSTLRTHAVKLLSWGKTLGLIPRRRYSHI